MQIHIILKVFNQILWFFAHERESYSTLKLTWFYDTFTKLLWQTLVITITKSKYGFVHISNSTLNFSKVAPNWIQWLIWLKKGKFEVPISTIKLVTNRDLKTRQPLKFVTFNYRGVETSELPVICKMRCRSGVFSHKPLSDFPCSWTSQVVLIRKDLARCSEVNVAAR
jgi:hypothetical protein